MKVGLWPAPPFRDVSRKLPFGWATLQPFGKSSIPAALHRALRSDGMSDWPQPESDLSLLRDIQCVVHLDA